MPVNLACLMTHERFKSTSAADLVQLMTEALVLEVTRERSQLRLVESRRASPARNQTTFVRSQRGQKGK